MIAALRQFLLPSAPGALRLWLALVVVLHHATRIEIGKAPVLVFFALSGYWVQRVWTTRYSATRAPWLTFVVSRWWRLAPVMVIAVVLGIPAMAVLDDPRLPQVLAGAPRQAFSSVFVLGYALLPVRPVGPAWSLDIEMQFYLAAPALVWVARRLGPIGGLACSYVVYAAGLMVWPELVLSSFVVFFMLGVAAAQANWSVDPRLATAGQGLAVALVVLVCLSPWRQHLLGEGSAWWPDINLLLAALVLPQALVSVRGQGGPLDKACADQSYIVYMLHWPAILALRAVAWPDEGARAVGILALGTGVALACLAVHRWVDRPCNRARARWVAGRLRAAPWATKGDDSPAVFA